MRDVDESLIQKYNSNQSELYQLILRIISETNGISLRDTLSLCLGHRDIKKENKSLISEFIELLNQFEANKVKISTLLVHDLSYVLFYFFKNFPLKYREEHIHLTGSLDADFIYPRLKPLLEGPHKDLYMKKIREVYGDDIKSIDSAQDVDRLIRLKSHEAFDKYLQILYLPKLLLTSRKAHEEASYHMAQKLYGQFNVGMIRLKFTLSRASTNSMEQVPRTEQITEEDVVLGLYEGFMKFRNENPNFDFALSPCFRKEADFYDGVNFKNKKEHFNHQVDVLLDLVEKYPELKGKLQEVDTVGSEKELYRKSHFEDMKKGFRKLQYKGFFIRSHHGETWHTLRKGVQAVDNAMNIWRIDTLEHGISLGINPNFYFHQLYQQIIHLNQDSKAIENNSQLYNELIDMDWGHHQEIRSKILDGKPLSKEEEIKFLKVKFHTAREIETYQHDVLNRMIQKGMSLIALPTSNKRLTGSFQDFKEHPFSWWEKKGVNLGIGTDNYVTLNTHYIRELLIMLYTDATDLKITKLLMVATGEKRRAYISQFLWKMREGIL